MNCKNCGTQLNEHAKFCLECGTKVDSNLKSEQQKPQNVTSATKEDIRKSNNSIHDIISTYKNKFITLLDDLKGKGIKEIFAMYKANAKFWVIVAIAFVCAFSLFSGLNTNPIESRAESCIKQLKKIENVKSIEGYACIRNVNSDNEQIDKYVIFYTDTYYSSLFACFNNELEYLGDGSNGGYASSSLQYDENNFVALYSVIDVLEFIYDNFGYAEEFSKKAYSFDNEEGIIYIKNFDLMDWINNY